MNTVAGRPSTVTLYSCSASISSGAIRIGMVTTDMGFSGGLAMGMTFDPKRFAKKLEQEALKIGRREAEQLIRREVADALGPDASRVTVDIRWTGEETADIDVEGPDDLIARARAAVRSDTL
jgi:hypothetical protein